MKRGFTTVEVIITFGITIVLATMLFQLVIIMNDIYNINETKTELINDISLVTYSINDKISNNTITNINDCGNNCIELVYLNGTRDTLKIDGKSILFGEDNYVFDDNTNLASLQVDKISVPINANTVMDSVALIQIHLVNDYVSYDEFVKIAYQFNSVSSNVVIQ